MKRTREVCRYCLAVGYSKNLYSYYKWKGNRENFKDIIMETYNIKVAEDKIKQGICEKCISQLRNAASFKKKVVQAERKLQVYLQNETEIKSYSICNVKEEDGFGDHASVDFKFDVDKRPRYLNNKDWDKDTVSKDCYNNEALTPGKLVVIKIESDQSQPDAKDLNTNRNEMKNNRDTYNLRIKNLLETSRSKNDFESNADDNSNSGADFDFVAEEVNLRGSPEQCKIERRKDIISKLKIVDTKKTEPKTITNSATNAKDNTMKLVLNSNMLLFYTKRLKFKCFSCKEAYIDIKELREHSKTHTNVKYLKKRLNQIRGLTYRMAEITNLRCKVCEESCADLNELSKHLTEKHKVDFSDDGNYLVPYRLESDNDIKCVLCEKKFNTFLRLKGHMNRHFSNNVCEVCGISYVNRVSLRVHTKMHGEHKCKLCSAVFSTNYNKLNHIRKFHKTSLSVRYCRICNKTFPYTYKLMEHKIQEHGAQPTPKVSCNECGKMFQNQNGLKIHMRGVHLKERNYPCNVCEMRFFTKHDKNRHERTHMDFKSFACNYCDVRFKTKDSLRRHLKRQHVLT